MHPTSRTALPASTDAPMSAFPGRRTIMRGAAWSVPVIAVAVAAPLAAASVAVVTRLEVVSDPEQSIDEVNLVVFALDSDGNGVPGAIYATMSANPAARFVAPVVESADGLQASFEADETGIVAFPIEATAPVTLTITLVSGSASTITTLTIVP